MAQIDSGYFPHLTHYAPHYSLLANENTDSLDAPCVATPNSSSRFRDSGEDRVGSLVSTSSLDVGSSITGIYVTRAIQTDMTDENMFPFLDNNTKRDGVPPNIRRTQDLVDRYFKNIDSTRHALFQSSSLPVLPDDIWNDVLASRFVDLGRIYLAYETLGWVILTARQWEDTFVPYMNGVCLAFPHRKQELRTWIEHIKGLFGSQPEHGHPFIIRVEHTIRQAVFDSRARSLNDPKTLGDLHSNFVIGLAVSVPELPEHFAKTAAEAKQIGPPIAANSPNNSFLDLPEPSKAPQGGTNRTAKRNRSKASRAMTTSLPNTPKPRKAAKARSRTGVKRKSEAAPPEDAKGELAEDSEDGSGVRICTRWNWSRCAFDGNTCKLRHVCITCRSEKHVGKDCRLSRSGQATAVPT